MSQTYKYDKTELQSPSQIRLIRLLPDDPADQTLRCELVPTALANAPQYVALSYTWGEDVFPHQLFVDDATIPITENLHQALTQLRVENDRQPQWLWVDAVCINQNDETEKAAQIALMSQIYSCADEVAVWLGRGDAETHDVMRFFQDTGSRYIEKKAEILTPDDGREDHEGTMIWQALLDEPRLVKQRLVWERPWFRRRWIVQELAFARSVTVHLGPVNMSWESLSAANEVLMMVSTTGAFIDQYVKKHSTWLRARNESALHATILHSIRKKTSIAPNPDRENCKIFQCIADASQFDCKEDKDRIFALLGIFNRGRTECLSIDYSLSAAEVFKQFARFCLDKGEPSDCLDMLAHAGLSRHFAAGGSPLQLPSWVPDWRVKLGPADTLNGFSAAIHLATSMQLDQEKDELTVRGLVLDRVLHVHPPISSFGSDVLWLEALEVLFSSVFGPFGSRSLYAISDFTSTAWEALARTLIMDRQVDLIFSPSASITQNGLFCEYPNLRNAIFSELQTLRRGIDPPPRRSSSDRVLQVLTYEFIEYRARKSTCCLNQSFFITERGYIGLGPKETTAEQGDIVCLPAGVCTPYVLRPEKKKDLAMTWDEGADIKLARPGYMLMPDDTLKTLVLRAEKPRYQLVGECYVQGLMNGKAWDMPSFPLEELILI